jgi:tetratricopeptide (TPR) repeat protein
MMENIGISLFKLGRLDEAEASFDEALAIFNVIDDTIGIAWAPYHQSRIASRRGDLDKAARLADRAVDNSEKNPEGDLEINAKFEVAHILYHRGENEIAKAQFMELEQAFVQAGNEISTGESALMLARIALRQKDYVLAHTKMNEALKSYEANSVGYYILDATITRTDLAFVHDNYDKDAACTSLRQHLQGMQHTETALRARSRLLRCDGAVNDLSSVETDARAIGMFEPRLDAIKIRALFSEETGKSGIAKKIRARGQKLAATKGWVFQ